MAGEIADDQADQQEDILGILKEVAEDLQHSAYTQRIDQGEHRANGLEGHEIAGAFQMPLAVQHQSCRAQANTDGGQDDQIYPAFGHQPMKAVDMVAGDDDLVEIAVFHAGAGKIMLEQEEIVIGAKLHHGAVGGKALRADHYAVHQRAEDRAAEPHDDHGEEIDDGVHRGGSEAVAGEHHAENRQAEEEQIVQRHTQQPQQAGVPKFAQEQHQRQADDGIGHQVEQKSRCHMGKKPAFPAQWHSMQRVAQPGVKQVAEQKLGSQSGKAEGKDAHRADESAEIFCQIIEVTVANARGESHQQSANEV